MTQFPGVV